MIKTEYKSKHCITSLFLATALLIGALHTSACSNTPSTGKMDLVLSSNYEITAALNPDENLLDYTARVEIRNEGHDRTNELFFHLYGNLYKTETEGIAVNSITDAHGKAVLYELRDNDQLICVTLNDKLKSGGETTIIFTCAVKIPEMANIFGVARDGEIHLPFFYPQLAVYDKNGWNTKPLAQVGDGRYLAMSDYMLTIQAPSEYEIVCNGIELLRESQNGQTTHVFQANQRREIFIAAFTAYVHLERIVGNTTIFGYYRESPDSPIDIDDMNSVMDASAFSMECYNRIFMEYPYETLIIVRSAWAHFTEVNMEYSGLFTIASMGDENGEKPTYHEMAHQWFYFLVGNNENAEPWLDESFAEFASILCWETAGYTEVSAVWWEFQKDVAHIYEDGKPINVSYDEADNYTRLFYDRGSYFLKELMDAIGKDEFLSILSEYCKTYAYKVASTEDFISLLRERSPVDVESIINEYISISSD